MKMNEFVKDAKAELIEEKKELAKSVIKERLKEIKIAQKTLVKLEEQYENLLEKDVDDIVEDLDDY